ACTDGDRAQAVETVEAAGFGDFLERNQVGHGDQRAIAAAYVGVAQVRGRHPRLATGLYHHLVFLAVVDVGGDAARPHHRLQGAPDLGDRYAQVGRTRPVDLHAHL